MKCLIIGYGNTLCGDDSLGPVVAQRLAKLLTPQHQQQIHFITLHQLDVVLASQLSNYSLAIFIDAQQHLSSEAVVIENITSQLNQQPELSSLASLNTAVGFSGHFLSPQALLTITRELYQTCPQTWVVAIRGYAMEMGEDLSPAAEINAQEAVQKVLNLLNQFLPLS